MLHLWHAPIYTDGIAPEARFPRERYARVRQGIEEQGPSDRLRFHEPVRMPDLGDLHLAHCQDYTNRFLTGTLGDKESKRIGLQPWTESIVERTLILTNGTISATRQIAENGGVAGNLGGGTHHAYFDFGSGYCIFNDLAISARIAQRDYGLKRVLILDLDVHQGDGTAAIFEHDPTVRTVSFHCGDNFPFRKMRSDHDQAFRRNTQDDEYLETLQSFLESEFERFEPDILFFQAGVDSLETDRLGNLNLTRSGLQTRNQLVFQFAKDHCLPLLITMGGGYGEPLDTSVAAHVDLFLQAADLG